MALNKRLMWPSAAASTVPPARLDGAARLRRLLAFVLGGSLLVGVALHLLGIVSVDPSAIAHGLRGAGPAGALLLIVLFALGAVANIPGLVFVAAAVTLYGPAGGYVVALLGAIAAVNLTFALARLTGLGNSALLERPMIARVTRMLHDRPILTLTVLRALVLVSPPVNYALALTRLRHRDYALGSALGLVLPMLVVTSGLSCLL